MNTVRLRSLCQALNLSTARAEQWISRGYFKPSESGVAGRARELTKKDAGQLLALSDLVDAGFDAAHIYREVQHLHLFQRGKAFLVVSTGYLGRIIPSTPRGGPGAKAEDCLPIYVPGHLYSDIVAHGDLPKVLAQKQRHVSIVVCLDHLLSRIEKAWREIERTQSGALSDPV